MHVPHLHAHHVMQVSMHVAHVHKHLPHLHVTDLCAGYMFKWRSSRTSSLATSATSTLPSTLPTTSYLKSRQICQKSCRGFCFHRRENLRNLMSVDSKKGENDKRKGKLEGREKPRKCKRFLGQVRREIAVAIDRIQIVT